ncbi:MAG: penicillin-binding protein activator [archaeon]
MKGKIIFGVIVILVVLIIIIGAYFGSSTALFSISSKNNKEVKIGALLPLSGAGAWIGEAQKEGIILAEEEINSKNSESAVKLDIIFEDSASNAQQGVSGFTKLTSVDDVQAVFSSLSSVSNAILPIAMQTNTPILLQAVSLPNITQRSLLAFRFFVDSDAESKKAAKFMLNQGIKRVAILYLNDEFGVGAKDSFEKSFEIGGKVIFEDAYLGTDSDFRTKIAQINELKPDAIFVIGYTSVVPKIVVQLKENDSKAKIFLNMAMAAPPFLKAAGNAIEGAYFINNYFDVNSTDAKIQLFVKNYRIRFNKDPNFFSAFAYDATNALEGAIKKNGSTKEQILTGLENIKIIDGVMGSTKVLPNHGAEYPLRIMQMQNWVLVSVE